MKPVTQLLERMRTLPEREARLLAQDWAIADTNRKHLRSLRGELSTTALAMRKTWVSPGAFTMLERGRCSTMSTHNLVRALEMYAELEK